MKKIEEEIKEILELVEQIYFLEVSDMTKRLENLKRINIESLAAHIKKEQEKGNVKSKKEIIKFIQSIIRD